MKKCQCLLIRFLIITAITFLLGCDAEPYPSIFSVYESWLEAKEDMNLKKVDDFKNSLDNFFTSPVGNLYFVQITDEMRSLDETASAVLERLKNALINNDDEAIFNIILEMDRTINLLMHIDVHLTDTSQMYSFMLFFFFSVLIIGIVLALHFMHIRLEKAELSEKDSLAFSQETVMAQELERQRIARELHDSALQDLWRLSFQIENAGKITDMEERNRICAEIVKEQKDLMRRIRNICDNLIPPDFHLRSLDETIRSFCCNFEQRTGIECNLYIQKNLEIGTLDTFKQLHCFRIIQESFTNIEKHAQASKISLLVRISIIPGQDSIASELLICVSDNGIGFPSTLIIKEKKDFRRKLRKQGHLGLWNMYERTASLGGTLILNSEAGEGTSITLRIPLHNREES
jgi:signal transduction histidine kinase